MRGRGTRGHWAESCSFLRRHGGEKKIEGGYDLSTDSKRNTAENRVRGYATSAARPALRHPMTTFQHAFRINRISNR